MLCKDCVVEMESADFFDCREGWAMDAWICPECDRVVRTDSETAKKQKV